MKTQVSHFFKNQETLFIILYNGITLVSYHMGELQPIYVLWAYYLQSLYIGAKYWFIEACCQYRTKEPNWGMTLFFPIHFGGFHLGYLVFLLIAGVGSEFGSLWFFLKINALVLFVQFIIFALREVKNTSRRHSLALLATPYLRIIPMHLVIILGFTTTDLGVVAFDIFIVLKTLIDLFTSRWFHKRNTIDILPNGT